MGAGAQALGPPCATFLDNKQGTGSKLEHLGLEPVPMCDASSEDGELTC